MVKRTTAFVPFRNMEVWGFLAVPSDLSLV